MKRSVSLGLAALLGATVLGTPGLAEQPMYIVRSLSVPMELKDPFHAYAIGMMPLGGICAASYVGTTRFAWSPPAEYKLASYGQTAVDAILLGAMGSLFYLASTADSATPDGNARHAQFLAGGILSLVAVPLVHLFWFAPYWGEQAVQFNRDALRQDGFKVPDAQP